MTERLVFLLLFAVDYSVVADYTQRRIDLALIIDTSCSNGNTNLKPFLQHLVSLVDIDEGKVRVGAVDNAQVKFHLNSNLTSAGVRSAIGKISCINGSTNTALALELTRTDMFTTVNGDRDNADNVAVLITDGAIWSNPPTDEAAALKNKHVRLIVVVSEVGPRKYENISSSLQAEHIFQRNTFDGVPELASSVVQAATKPGRSCQRYKRQGVGNNCLEFSFKLSALGQDFQKVSSVALQESLGKDRSECAELCIRHAECLSFVIRDDGRCQLFDLICNVSTLANAPSSSVYVIQHGP